jgi:soluble lytic murein transglycosylase-like protein
MKGRDYIILGLITVLTTNCSKYNIFQQRRDLYEQAQTDSTTIESLKKEIETLEIDNEELRGENQSLEKRLSEIESYMTKKYKVEDIQLGIKEYDLKKYFEIFPEAEQYYEPITNAIEEFSHIYPVDTLLVYIMLGVESSNRNGAVSNRGAAGPLQITPGTAQNPTGIEKEPFMTVYVDENYETAQEYTEKRRTAQKLYNRGMANLKKFLNKYPNAKDDDKNLMQIIRNLLTANSEYEALKEEEDKYYTLYKEKLEEIAEGMEAPGYTGPIDERFDRNKSTRAAVLHIAHLLKKYDGNLIKVLSTYNSGRSKIPIFIETIRYIEKIYNRILYYRDLLAKPVEIKIKGDYSPHAIPKD